MQNKNRNPLAKASEGNKDSFRSIGSVYFPESVHLSDLSLEKCDINVLLSLGKCDKDTNMSFEKCDFICLLY